MRRKIYNELMEWKNGSNGKTALLIEGARRVGKSYIVEEFAKNNYQTYILIDFSKVDNQIKNLFDNYLTNLDDFFLYLENFYSTKLYERKTLIIFDEVQRFPRAREAIKHLVADGRYDYIETGSLMSIKENVQDILIPSEERHITMYPLDFEEFLWAMENEMLMDFIRKCYADKKPLGEALHRKAMDYFKKYMIVGGMPQAVLEYINTKDFEKVDLVKRDILKLYRDDIRKHAGKYSLKVESIFDEIPSQLQKHEKKFNISSLNKDARSREYADSFMWLTDAMVANACFNSTEPTVGLKLTSDNSAFKLYMSDTGLLMSHSFDENGIISNEVYKKILFDKLSLNEGMLMENIVAQMLISTKRKLYFYSNYSANKEDRMEVDFLITKREITNKHNVCPIEVKSGKNYTTVSLDKYQNKFKNAVGNAYIIHTKDLRIESNIIYLPIYMTILL